MVAVPTWPLPLHTCVQRFLAPLVRLHSFLSYPWESIDVALPVVSTRGRDFILPLMQLYVYIYIYSAFEFALTLYYHLLSIYTHYLKIISILIPPSLYLIVPLERAALNRHGPYGSTATGCDWHPSRGKQSTCVRKLIPP